MPLRPGDRVALVAPAGTVDRDRLLAERRYLESLGLEVVTRLPRQPDRYLAGTDKERAAEFLTFWNDRKVAALFSVRGGFGCARLLPLLAGKVGGRAKLFSGFSDNTVLHQFLMQQGIEWSLHGPHPGSFGKPPHIPTRRRYEAFLFGKVKPGLSLGSALALSRKTSRIRGRLTGGNLAVLAAMCGTPSSPKLPGIVFLEDINEQVYRLDAFLTQLRNSGALNRTKALVMGDFSPPKGAKNYRKTLHAWFAAIERDLGVPVYTGFPAGHGRRNLSLPLGADVDLSDGKLLLNRLPWDGRIS